MKELFDWLDSPAADPYWIGAMVSAVTIWIVWVVLDGTSRIVRKVMGRIRDDKVGNGGE